MIKQFLVLAFATAFPVVGSAVTITATATTPPKTEVSGQLVATKIQEIALVQRAIVFEPKFVFSENFGYGTEVLPRMGQYPRDWTNVSTYICKQFGYGAPVSTSGSRPNPSKVTMEFVGQVGAKTGSGLALSSYAAENLPANLTCRLK